ncbi:ninjurin-2-like [Saccoglossus kowalevskii]|nr:PREDICTED: ninjurin-2-like isoform X1 [Saccoglossus kowalevskii]XP_006814839.1 PREDICTED: ninjurin-2-like isoform X3 [Saccoglossus kowalevskii]
MVDRQSEQPKFGAAERHNGHTTTDDIEMGQIATTTQLTGSSNTTKKRPFDANSYAGKKTVAQGFIDVALLTANGTYLASIWHNHNKGSTPEFFVIINIGLVISIILQLVTSLLLVIKYRLDISKEEDQPKAEKMTDAVSVLVMLILFVNVFIGAFSVQ